MNLITLWRSLASGGLIGLIFWIILWNGWLTPVQEVPRWIELLLLLTPLMLMVRGVLHGRPSTHVYALLASLFYASMGCWYAMAPPDQWYGYVLLFLSVCLYVGGYMTAKILGKQQTQITKEIT